jgi:ADP-dependent NAD(P)H-hydrate dehydratase / NAD(P)H-hydrate epimerase
MKIFRSDQIRELDNTTILNEPVSSADLMERAAARLFNWYVSRFERNRKIFIFAGPGNNGGDGLALARLLAEERYDVELHYISFTQKTSPDWELNYQKLKRELRAAIKIITSHEQFPFISKDDVLIDAIFGSGLTRPVEGLPYEIIRNINNAEAIKISVDMPSGLFCEDNSTNNPSAIVKADYTLTFQFPKLSFMFADNAEFVGKWEVLPIGLSDAAIRNTPSQYLFLGHSDIAPLLRKRKRFDHKGVFGHGLLVAGSKEKMGAAVLGAAAALRSGIGLITCHIPSSGRVIMQTSVPEAMVHTDLSEDFISELEFLNSYSAVAIGPGIGTRPETQKMLLGFLKNFRSPAVIDADAINILSANKEWFKLLHAGIILTPHPKEFERLAGAIDNGFTRVQKQVQFSRENNCVVVLKGAFTSVSTPGGNVSFNSTGNPGMATAGSGDVLTGIILSLLSQGYSTEFAAMAGVFLHGLAGDIAAENSCFESIIASDIINNIGKAYNRIREVTV